MFIQVIQGSTKDADGLRRQFDRWEQEVGPGAKGFLGTTGGIAADGTVVIMARFENEDAARANSERPEQGAWWNETSKYFDGEPTFIDSSDVEIVRGGGSDTAGFVQVMQGRVRDRDRAHELETQYASRMEEMRPDVLGIVRAWNGDQFTQAIYFTSEADARGGEAKMGGDQAGQEGVQEFMSLFEDVTYVDLTDPILRSAP